MDILINLLAESEGFEPQFIFTFAAAYCKHKEEQKNRIGYILTNRMGGGKMLIVKLINARHPTQKPLDRNVFHTI